MSRRTADKERHAARLDAQERQREMDVGKMVHERLIEEHGAVMWNPEKGSEMRVPKCPSCGGPMPVNMQNYGKCQDCGEVRS